MHTFSKKAVERLLSKRYYENVCKRINSIGNNSKTI